MTASASLPADPEAERALLGCLLLDQGSIAKVATKLRAEDFSQERNRTMYRAAQELFMHAEPIDPTTLAATMEQLTGHNSHHEYIDAVLAQQSNPDNVLSYAQIVVDHSKRRRAQRIGQGLAESSADVSKAPAEIVNDTLSKLMKLGTEGKATEFERAGDKLLTQFLDRMNRKMQGEGIEGIRSGFMDIDRITGGFRPGELTIIAGRPSMGKTTLALNIALDVSLKQHIPVAMFSLEMSKEILMARLVSQVSGIDSKLIMEGNLDDEDYERIYQHVGPLSEAPLWIDDDPDLDEISLLSKSQMAYSVQGARCIVLDYVTLMHSATDKSGNREQEVSRCIRAIRSVARTLSIPVIACAQLSRKVEDRADKHPILSDLRESGDLENAADVVILMYRDEYYNRASTERNIAEANIAKQRNGPIGTAKLGFRPALTQFFNLHQ